MQLLVYVDLHGHSRKHNVFTYGCHAPQCDHTHFLNERVLPFLLSQEASFVIKRYTYICTHTTTSELLELTHISPYTHTPTHLLTHTHTSSHTHTHTHTHTPPHTQTPDMFCFRSCKFKVHRSKEATGRVVVWKMGVANSFTMEATFCGSTLGTVRWVGGWVDTVCGM